MDIKSCSYCCKEFSRRDSLTRHLNRCKIKKEKEKKIEKENEIENKIEKNKIEILEKYNTELLKTVEKLLIEYSNNRM